MRLLAEHAEAVLREALSRSPFSVDDYLTIDVTDDGIGLPPAVARTGLHNRTVRAEQAGDTCTITAPDGGGTTLTWTAPLRNRDLAPPGRWFPPGWPLEVTEVLHTGVFRVDLWPYIPRPPGSTLAGRTTTRRL